jgi:hypothetical protein
MRQRFGVELGARVNARGRTGDKREAISQTDVLVLDQHETKPRIEVKRAQFASAIGVAVSSALVASGRRIAKDVVFF